MDFLLVREVFFSLVFMRTFFAFVGVFTRFWFGATFNAEESLWTFLAHLLTFISVSSLLTFFHLLANFTEMSSCARATQSTANIQEMASWAVKSSYRSLWAIMSIRACFALRWSRVIGIGTFLTHLWCQKTIAFYFWAIPADWTCYAFRHAFVGCKVSVWAFQGFCRSSWATTTFWAFCAFRRSDSRICACFANFGYILPFFTPCSSRADFACVKLIRHACSNTRVALWARIWFGFTLVTSSAIGTEWTWFTMWPFDKCQRINSRFCV